MNESNDPTVCPRDSPRGNPLDYTSRTENRARRMPGLVLSRSHERYSPRDSARSAPVCSYGGIRLTLKGPTSSGVMWFIANRCGEINCCASLASTRKVSCRVFYAILILIFDAAAKSHLSYD